MRNIITLRQNTISQLRTNMKYNFYITSSFEIKEPYYLYIVKLDMDKSLFA